MILRALLPLALAAAASAAPAQAAATATVKAQSPAFHQLVPAGAAVRVLAEGITWAEGPVWIGMAAIAVQRCAEEPHVPLGARRQGRERLPRAVRAAETKGCASPARTDSSPAARATPRRRVQATAQLRCSICDEGKAPAGRALRGQEAQFAERPRGRARRCRSGSPTRPTASRASRNRRSRSKAPDRVYRLGPDGERNRHDIGASISRTASPSRQRPDALRLQFRSEERHDPRLGRVADRQSFRAAAFSPT